MASGRVVNKRELAEVFGVTERTLTEWQEKGMPILRNSDRGRANQYDTAACIEWRIQHVLGGEQRETAKERLDRVSADLKETELAERLGILVPALGVQQAIEAMVVAARQEVLAMPYKIQQHLAAHGIEIETDYLDECAHNALTRLGQYDPDAGAGDAASGEAVESAAADVD